MYLNNTQQSTPLNISLSVGGTCTIGMQEIYLSKMILKNVSPKAKPTEETKFTNFTTMEMNQTNKSDT